LPPHSSVTRVLPRQIPPIDEQGLPCHIARGWCAQEYRHVSDVLRLRHTSKHSQHSARLRHNIHQGSATFLDDDFEGTLERWPQDAYVFHRSFGVDAESPRHRGEIHRRLI
jgi:hypothetical protein